MPFLLSVTVRTHSLTLEISIGLFVYSGQVGMPLAAICSSNGPRVYLVWPAGEIVESVWDGKRWSWSLPVQVAHARSGSNFSVCFSHVQQKHIRVCFRNEAWAVMEKCMNEDTSPREVIAEPILREALGDDTDYKWMEGWKKDEVQIVIRELAEAEVEEWTDGSRPRQMEERPRTLMWVKGHDGVEGNEEADRKAKGAVRKGKRMHKPDIATPAGIRQAFRIHEGAPAHLKWNRTAIRGLTYMITDKGPQAGWMKEIGKVDDGSCPCDGWTLQNAAHLLSCPWVEDGKGRTREMLWKDEKWCEELARFVM